MLEVDQLISDSKVMEAIDLLNEVLAEGYYKRRCSGVENAAAGWRKGGETIISHRILLKCEQHMKHFLWILFLATSASFAQPVINGFTPQKGAVGQTVVITGSNFNTTAANNIVYFGATRAVVTVANAGSITATVPPGASYAPITVINTGTGLSAYSRTNFHPVFTPNKNTITITDFAPKQDFTTAL